MKTFDEAFVAALGVSSPDESTPEFQIVAKNLEDQGRDILASKQALKWARNMAAMAWDQTGETIDEEHVMGWFLSGLMTGVRVGIEMEKE